MCLLIILVDIYVIGRVLVPIQALYRHVCVISKINATCDFLSDIAPFPHPVVGYLNMRISYAIILAAIAMFEGCKPKEAVAPPKNDGGDDDAADQDGGENNEENDEGGNALGGGQDPKNLKPNPKQSSKEKLQKAHEVVRTCKNKLSELESSKVKLVESFDAANTDFEQANDAFEKAKLALDGVESKKTQLADALLGGPGSPGETGFKYPIERLRADDMHENLRPIVEAVQSVPKLDAANRPAALTEALALLSARLTGLSSSLPTGWTGAMTDALRKLTQDVQAELRADANAIADAKQALVDAIYRIAYTQDVRAKARELRTASTSGSGDVDTLTGELVGMTQSLGIPSAANLQDVLGKLDVTTQQAQRLRERFVGLFQPRADADGGDIPEDIWNQVRGTLRNNPEADIRPFAGQIMTAYRRASPPVELGVSSRGAFGSEAPRNRRQTYTVLRTYSGPGHAVEMRSSGRHRSFALDSDDGRDSLLAQAAAVAASYLEATRDEKKLNEAVVKKRDALVETILSDKDLSADILAAADSDAPESAKTLSDLIAADRKARADAFAEERQRVNALIEAARAAGNNAGSFFPKQLDLYGTGKRLNRLVGLHETLKALVYASATTEKSRADCLAAMDILIPKPPTDTLHDAIDAYRAATSAEEKKEKGHLLIQAYEDASMESRRNDKPNALHLYMYREYLAAKNALGSRDVGALDDAKTVKEGVLDAAKAKVAAKDKEIDAQRGECRKAEEVVGKLIIPE